MERVILDVTLVPENLSLRRLLAILCSKRAVVEHMVFDANESFQIAHLQVQMPDDHASHIVAAVRREVCVIEVVETPSTPD